MHIFGSKGTLKRGLYRAGHPEKFGLGREIGRAVWEAMGLAEDSVRWKSYGITAASGIASQTLASNASSRPRRGGGAGGYVALRKLMWDPATSSGRGNETKLTKCGQRYGLSLNEMDSVGWYTAPQVGWHGGEVPSKADHEAGQRDVAQALTRAIAALPSLGDLGLEAPVFRVTGGAEAVSCGKLRVGTLIVHGNTKLPNDSYHFMSTSLTPNVKGFAMNLPEAGEVLAIYGNSGRYIQWLGRHSLAMDGGEVLYTPGTVTCFKGRVSTITVGKRSGVPVYLLVECAPDVLLRERATIVEDFKLRALRGGDSLYRRVCELRATHATAGRRGGQLHGDEENRVRTQIEELNFQQRRREFFATATEETPLLSTPQRYG